MMVFIWAASVFYVPLAQGPDVFRLQDSAYLALTGECWRFRIGRAQGNEVGDICRIIFLLNEEFGDYG